jgi:hypothetical protein
MDPGEMIVLDVPEMFGEANSFLFPSFYLDRVQLALQVDPVNNNPGVTKDPKVIQGPK